MSKGSAFPATEWLELDELESGPAPMRHACVGCALLSPVSDDESSLLSMKYGWRLSRTPDGHGGHAYAWRCPACWKKLKQRRSL
jgi:hypothetical protein